MGDMKFSRMPRWVAVVLAVAVIWTLMDVAAVLFFFSN